MGNKHSVNSLRAEVDIAPTYGTAHENGFPPGSMAAVKSEAEPSPRAPGSARTRGQQQQPNTPESLTAQSIKNTKAMLEDVRKHSMGKPVWVAIVGPPFSGVKHFLQLVQRELYINCVLRKTWTSVRQELQQENKLYHWAGIVTLLNERQEQYYTLAKNRQEEELSFLHGSYLLDGVAIVEAARRSNLLSVDSAEILRRQTNTIFWENEKALCPSNSTLYIYLQPSEQNYEAKLQQKFGGDAKLIQFYKNIKTELDNLFLRTEIPSGVYTRLVHVEDDYRTSRNSSILVVERIAMELQDYATRAKETGWCRDGPAVATKNEERKFPSMGLLQRNSQKIRIVPSIQQDPQKQLREEKKDDRRFSRNTTSLDLQRKLPSSPLSRTTSEKIVVIKPTDF